MKANFWHRVLRTKSAGSKLLLRVAKKNPQVQAKKFARVLQALMFDIVGESQRTAESRVFYCSFVAHERILQAYLGIYDFCGKIRQGKLPKMFLIKFELNLKFLN